VVDKLSAIDIILIDLWKAVDKVPHHNRQGQKREVFLNSSDGIHGLVPHSGILYTRILQ